MGITIQQLLIFQMIVDVVLCIAVTFLLWAIIKYIRKRPQGVDEKTLSEFRKMLDESQGSAENLVRALDEGSAALNEKEKRMENLIKRSEIQIEKLNAKSSESADAFPAEKYEDVIKMVKRGFTEKEVSKSLGLTEGEISLIVNLDHRKNENS